MNQAQAKSLEEALLDTVETELNVMQSLCDSQFPCDLSTTIAMRLSRAVVWATCRTVHNIPGHTNRGISTQTASALIDAQEQMERLSLAYERKLGGIPADAVEWQTWRA